MMLFAWAITAKAWEWDTSGPNGDSFTYHICLDNFTSDEKDEIEFAANGWDAGSTEDMRGALWNFYRGSDYSGCGTDNGDDEVYKRSRSWFDNHGGGDSDIGLCIGCLSGAGINDRDIAFLNDDDLEDMGFVWAAKTPSGCVGDGTIAPPLDEVSIGQVALHEFGHLIGFLHENTVLATMNQSYPNGGDISKYKYRIQEDDYVGLTVKHSGSSTGKNLLLGRFHPNGSEAIEKWDNETLGWQQCQELVDDEDGPAKIMAIIHGTSCQDPVIEWWLSADDDCETGTAYPVGSSQPSLCSGLPFMVGPNPYDFRNVPPGDYYLCAMIDPDNLIVESHSGDTDNQLVSETTLEVMDCP